MRMVKRYVLGALLIVALSAGATATAGLLEISDDVRIFSSGQKIPGITGVLDNVDAGQPQTILVLGSDRRYIDTQQHNPVRSDTMLLVRLDPSKAATAVMSIPRDLKVEIPGHGTDKINAAYAYGGPRLTVQTVKRLFHFPINHVVNINFGGFKRAVNRLGCVYVDVDRRYFNDNQPPFDSPTNYATIDIRPGYQKLCGSDALDYVRYRHLDNDFVRAARQQDFLRQAKDQFGLGTLFGSRKELLKIFSRYTQTDIRSTNATLRLLKLAFESSKNPIREVHFRGGISQNLEYVEITPGNLQRTRDEFLNARASTGPRQTGKRKQRSSGRKRSGLARGLMADKSESRGLRRRRRHPRAVPGLLPDGPARQGPLRARPAPRLRHLRPRPPPLPRLPHRRLHRRDRPVLRHPGHELDGAADPGQPVGEAADGRPGVRAVLRRQPSAHGRPAHQAGRVLGLEHPLGDPHQPADARHRPLADEGRQLSAVH